MDLVRSVYRGRGWGTGGIVLGGRGGTGTVAVVYHLQCRLMNQDRLVVLLSLVIAASPWICLLRIGLKDPA